MDDGLLSLKWNNHKSTFFHILSNLRKKETYTDATLACEGKFFPVHKLVMSTCSDYFSEVFERTTCKSPVVILKDIGYNDLEALLDYMYLGEVDVKQSELAGLIKAAECLRIKGLAVPDEDPSIHKKSTHVPDSRLSPSTKRSRRDSGGSDSSQHFIPSKGSRSHSPLNSSSSSRSHSTSSISSTPVPSHTVTADSLSQVPSHSMPPPIFSTPNASSSLNNNEVLQHQDQNIVPVDMIKVEVEEEGNNNSDIGAHNTSSERRSGGREEPRGEGGGSGDRSIKEPISNNFSEYTHHPGDIEKEEHDQMDYNGSEQLAGPSGVQGAPPIMNWGEEEGTFPHNLFGEDTSHQQVCIAIMDPELVAVRMFQGSKSQLAVHTSQTPLKKKQFHPQLSVFEISQPIEQRKIREIQHQQKQQQQQQQVEQLQTSLQPQYIHRDLQQQGVLLPQHTEVGDQKDKLVLVNPIVVDDHRYERQYKFMPLQNFDDTHQVQLQLNEQNPSENVSFTSPQDLSSPSCRHRTHSCPYCNYSTRSKVDLNKHVRVHTKEKPYKCPMCKYETGDRSNYRRHVAGVHKARDSEIVAAESQSLEPRSVSISQHLSEIIIDTPDSHLLSVNDIEMMHSPYSEGNSVTSPHTV